MRFPVPVMYTDAINTMKGKIVVIIVYLSLLLDNVLLTVVVPILPDYLRSVELILGNGKDNSTSNIDNHFNIRLQPDNKELEEETGYIGLLLSSKAFAQILINPVIGILTKYCGYHLPLFFGSINMLVATLLFALGENYLTFLVARTLHGIASACVGVTGMCLIAELYPSEAARSKVMGIVLGSGALGVLLGYPFGGILYAFVGKTAPFFVIAFLVVVDIGLQLSFLNLKIKYEEPVVETTWSHLLSDCLVVTAAGSILLTSAGMAILEPCLPLWLIEKMKPKKWQLGTVFIPDSLAYLIGTNFFGTFAYNFSRWRVAIVAMLLVGLSAVMVSLATDMTQLVLPHFGLGLGIGVLDAALVPMLASLMDTRHSAHYGSVYALQQTAVSLAYSLGPVIGGALMQSVGFPWVMRFIGLINILYSPLLVTLKTGVIEEEEKKISLMGTSDTQVNYKTSNEAITSRKYKRFYGSDESD
ncbi:synaptic vesicular amine transporter-like [Lycorma delicatula]|uniref:synaptic vesicular amine transporter-like n=1 Tax=Lycorma delicatula TaxID=130591 RepID=UPI003F51244A